MSIRDVILSAVAGTAIGGILWLNKVDQRVYIKKDLTLSTDTITADNCRFYYTRTDSTFRDIRVSVFRDKEAKPYITHKLEPNDYVNMNLKQGHNIMVIQELGQYPVKSIRIKVVKFEEVK